VRNHLVIVFLSDKHLLDKELRVPPGDLLVNCGDSSFMGVENAVEFDQPSGDLHPRQFTTMAFHEKAGQCQELSWLSEFILDVFLCPIPGR
jgi:hypothetical protein